MNSNSKNGEKDEGEDEPAKPGANIPKTPVSILQELYVRKGITPKYDLVQIEGAVHEPTFKYRVTVGDLVSTGCGQSKKKAKHSAAKAMIDKLKTLSTSQDGTGAVSKIVADVPSLQVADMISPYDDGINGNPVGELQELCMNRRMQPPIYTVSQEDGAPHERLFVMVCSVGGHYRETGLGKSKKLAKRQAAHKMLTSLKSMPADNDDGNFRLVDDDDLAQGIVTKGNARPGAEGSNPFQQLNKFHRNLKLNRGEWLASLHDKEKFDSNLSSNSVKLLEDVGAEQDFVVTFVDVEEKSNDDKYHCFVQLSTTPVAVFYGVGQCEGESRVDAARRALDYLRIMTLP